MEDTFETIFASITQDADNADLLEKGYTPVYTAAATARIIIVGQAPGRIAQTTHIPWNDKSGDLLREWLGLSKEQFYDPSLIALIPMDFYYPGKGKHGDNPPRKGFAAKWHPLLLEHMPHVELILLVGAYAQKYYLGATCGKNLTETVYNYRSYLPEFIPLVHPSPLNFRWRARNPWFEADVIPAARMLVQDIIHKNNHA